MPVTRLTSREIGNMEIRAEDLASDAASLKQVSGGMLELLDAVLADATYSLDTNPYTVELVRDSSGNLNQVLVKDGASVVSTITLNYGAGRLASVTETAGGRTVTTTLNYDASGILISVTKS